MKKVRIILSLMLILIGLQSSHAQFLKKLKDKVNKKIDQTEQKLTNKVEQEIDKTLDGTIDGLFEESNNTPGYSENNQSNNSEDADNRTYSGEINVNHSQNYGNVSINTLNKLKIERNNEGYNFWGSWMSHQVDIFDGYRLEIKTDKNLDLGKTYTFNIGQNANLTLGYDPQIPANKSNQDDFVRGVSDDYQNYNLESGFVKVTINSKESFQLEFSGQASLTKRTRSANDVVQESKYNASLMGKINGENPTFIDRKTITKSDEDSNPEASVLERSSSNNSAEAKSSYVFTHETVVEMTNSDSKDKYKLSYLLNPNMSYIGMKADMSEYSQGDLGGESLIVMDGDDTFIFVDTPGMKMQMSSSAMGNQQQQMQTDQMENYDYTNLNKTGNTKTILGYTCYEYVMSDDQNSIQMWVAPDLVVPNWFMQNQDVIQGHILEYSVDSPDGQMTITTLEIKDDINKTIKPSEYRKMF